MAGWAFGAALLSLPAGSAIAAAETGWQDKVGEATAGQGNSGGDTCPITPPTPAPGR